MIFHLSCDIPKKKKLSFDEDSEVLNSTEQQIIRQQIRKNAVVIDDYIERIHLFVNQEKYPRQEPFVERLRKRMLLLMEENDTFRKVLWKHCQATEAGSHKPF